MEKMTNAKRQTLALLVDNEPGVLSQIARLFSRKGYNIEAFAAGPTENPGVTRITIDVLADEPHTELLCNQLRKLYPVYSLKWLNTENSLYRELMLVKVKVSGSEQRNDLIQLANIFRAQIIDVSPETLTLGLAGDAVLGVKLDHGAQVVVIGGHRSAFTGSDRLHRMEAEAGNVGDRTDRPRLIRGADRVRSILDENQVVLVANLANRVVLNGAPAKVDSDNRLGLIRDVRLDARRVDIPCVGFDVGKDRRAAAVEYAVRAGSKGDGAHDDLIAGLYASRKAGDVQRSRAIRHRRAVLCARDCAERLLETFRGGATRQIVTAENLLHGGDIRIIDKLMTVAEHALAHRLTTINREALVDNLFQIRAP